jgi:dihydropteroate synthase
MLKLLEDNDVELVVPVKAQSLIPDPQSLIPRLYLDPMIGFGTTREEDVALLRSIPELAKKGRVLVGASRKRIVKKLVGEKSSVGKNIGGNVAIALWAALNGASAVRVHDVKETVQALRVIETLKG